MPTFRKIATIEARQFDPEHDYRGALDVMEWAGMRWADNNVDNRYDAIVFTLEDGPEQQVPHYASPGDWIAKGSHGEFYPIKSDIFAATYEQV